MSRNDPFAYASTIAETGETGRLGVCYLKRFWSRRIAAFSQTAGNSIAAGHMVAESDLVAEAVLLAGLRLGLRETAQFLARPLPTFEEFEDWVLMKNDGVLEPERVARLNGALTGTGSFSLESIRPQPVLSAADLAFWEEHGYVVVKQAASQEQCQAAVQAILDYAGMDLRRPDSWYAADLWIQLAHHPALWAIRQAGRIHTAFAQLWQRTDLWMNVDVCGVNPPERAGYRFRGTPLHWDMTLTPPIRFGTQALLYLTDTAADQGAFSCVPGFHRELESWRQRLPAGADPRAVAVQELKAIPIAGEAGDLIVWHHALPHGASPNRAALPRVVQYLNMFPSQFAINPEWS